MIAVRRKLRGNLEYLFWNLLTIELSNVLERGESSCMHPGQVGSQQACRFWSDLDRLRFSRDRIRTMAASSVSRSYCGNIIMGWGMRLPKMKNWRDKKGAIFCIDRNCRQLLMADELGFQGTLYLMIVT
jgi:hypothetical protein